jgi:hypothetical protein
MPHHIRAIRAKRNPDANLSRTLRLTLYDTMP